METLYYVVGGLAGVLLLITLTGWLFRKQHVARVQSELPHSPEAVWNAIWQVRSHPEWRRDLKSVEVIREAKSDLEWKETYRNGRTLQFKVNQANEPRKLVVALVNTRSFGGTWTYELGNLGKACKFLLTEEGFVANPLMRFFYRILRYEDRAVRALLADLTARLEAAKSAPVIGGPTAAASEPKSRDNGARRIKSRRGR